MPFYNRLPGENFYCLMNLMAIACLPASLVSKYIPGDSPPAGIWMIPLVVTTVVCIVLPDMSLMVNLVLPERPFSFTCRLP